MRAGVARAQCIADETSKVIPSDTDDHDMFGSAVDINGDLAVVGAPYESPGGTQSGSAYVFRRDGSSWVEEGKLVPSDGAVGDEFGHAVARAGDRAVVGAHSDDDHGDESGSAYVYAYNGSTWVQDTHLIAPDGGWSSHFGSSVSLSGGVIVIGADADSNENGESAGSAYVYRDDPGAPGTWELEATLLASDGAAYDWFGMSVAVSGDTAVIGALGHDHGGVDMGAAYVFRFDGSTWIEQEELRASDGAEGDTFGGSVALSGDVMVVGASASSVDVSVDRPGAVYVFRRDDNGTPSDPADDSWTEEAKLLAGDGAPDDRFGAGVGIYGDTIVIGAPEDDDNGEDSGSAYVFGGVSDCNEDGVIDICDIENLTSADCNVNTFPDECELAGNDCNTNGFPDDCDISGGTSADADSNGVPDECAAASAALSSSAPADAESLWRSANNFMRLTFAGDITGPGDNDLRIEVMDDGGLYGSTSYTTSTGGGADFTVAVVNDGRVLSNDAGTVFPHVPSFNNFKPTGHGL